jgi:alpha-beta hydrolase superfamily lysophospholipase
MALGLVLATILAVRAVDAWRAPPLKLWHTEVPRELKAHEIDRADWSTWMKAEDAVFAEVRTRVTGKLPAEDRIAANRFFEDSPMNPLRLVTDWNRTQVLEPRGKPRGAVVLLHGLTDSPYSLRHVAAHYRDRGFVAVTIRMPGHGTVPAGLTKVDWEDWMAATRMAVLHARVLAGEATPLHIVGYSNGGALALKYALDTLENPTLARPDQVILISPMIGITSFARFAGVLGWPAVFPPFAKAAWLDVVPEYNPIKYNSFPVNAARQSSQLVRNLDAQFTRLWSQGALKELPPILAFQSVVDSTVLVPALFDNLYSRMPNNGSAIVLFDRNWSADASALIRPDKANATVDIVPPGPRRYTVTVVQNTPGSAVPMAMTVAAESNQLTEAPLANPYPAQLYSLSHIALPFPLGDPLYGIAPDLSYNMGVRLGTVAVRGERGVLIVGSDTLMRATCNPFFDYLLDRIDATLPQ